MGKRNLEFKKSGLGLIRAQASIITKAGFNHLLGFEGLEPTGAHNLLNRIGTSKLVP